MLNAITCITWIMMVVTLGVLGYNGQPNTIALLFMTRKFLVLSVSWVGLWSVFHEGVLTVAIDSVGLCEVAYNYVVYSLEAFVIRMSSEVLRYCIIDRRLVTRVCELKTAGRYHWMFKFPMMNSSVRPRELPVTVLLTRLYCKMKRFRWDRRVVRPYHVANRPS